MCWHFGDIYCGFLLSNELVKEKSADSNLDIRSSNFEWKWSFPVKNPVWNDRDGQVTICCFGEGVEEKWNTGI